ncbi:MAG: hypothetical protein N2439_00425 [Anaerolineae bacterium]|nr:hypothetical protein [Anaerolineae bacterium]
MPRQWLRDVLTTGEFDARHLLLAMCDGSEYIAYPADARSCTRRWTRRGRFRSCSNARSPAAG